MAAITKNLSQTPCTNGRDNVSSASQRRLRDACYDANMRNFALTAIIAASLFTPLGALADNTPPPPSCPCQGPPGFRSFEQVHTQVDKVRSQARATMLNALSPQHRSLLAQVVGGLAIAQTPDVDAAAKTLDGALSPVESKAIIDASNALDQQIKQIMEAARPEFAPPGGAGGNAVYIGRPLPSSDAGMILLDAALPPMGQKMMMRIDGPPPPPPSQ